MTPEFLQCIRLMHILRDIRTKQQQPVNFIPIPMTSMALAQGKNLRGFSKLGNN